jgi:hypothetical protein
LVEIEFYKAPPQANLRIRDLIHNIAGAIHQPKDNERTTQMYEKMNN